MSMDNRERNLEAVSSIKDEIVERNTTKRFRLLGLLEQKAARKRIWMRSVSAAAALAVVLSAVILMAMLLGKQAPIYTGMTASGVENAPVMRAEEAVPQLQAQSADQPLMLALKNASNGKVDQPLPEYAYTATVGQDIYITVHFENPDELEIQSFILNGTKYVHYMFEKGSDLENVIVKVNVGEQEGVCEYTIDAIKYIHGEKIKDVRVQGEKSIKVSVTDKVIDSGSEQPNLTNGVFEYTVDNGSVTVVGLVDTGTVELVVPDTIDGMPVTGLAATLFTSCNQLKSITIPTSVTAIEGIAWSEALEEIVLKEGNTVYRMAGNCLVDLATKTLLMGFSNSSIPDDGSVTRIAPMAFYGRSPEQVIVPGSVKSIGERAFQGSALTELELLSGVESVLASAFYECEALESVTLPDTLTEIKDFAFFGCTALGELSIPTGMTKIAGGAFGDCSLLQTVIIHGENITLDIASDAFDGTAVKYLTCPLLLAEFFNGKMVGELTVNNGMVYGDLYLNGWKKVIWDTETALPWALFYNPWGGPANCLQEIEVRHGADVGDGVFENCTFLQKVVLSDGTSIGSYAFQGCSSLSDVRLPQDLTSIGTATFAGCSSLLQIELPEGLQVIGERAFANCTALTDIELPESLKSIGHSAFYGCSGLSGIELPEGLTAIGDMAFENCTDLAEIELPSTLNSVGLYAFDGCNALRYVKLNGSSLELGALFDDPEKTVKIELAEGVVEIEDRAFWGNTGIHEVVLPSTLTTIGVDAFSGCSSLQTVRLPQGLKTIKDRAFRGCTVLNGVTFPEGLTGIGANAFECCEALSAVSLPNSLTHVGSSAFSGCSGLGEVTLVPCVINFSQYFSGCDALTKITVAEGVSEIPDDAFFGCTSLEEIVLPSTLTAIGRQAFMGCTGLSRLALPDGLTAMGEDAFADCTSLAEIVFSTKLTAIGKGVFSGCTKLSRLELPDGMTFIDEEAFYGCTGLLQVSLPANLRMIEAKAFYGCDGITELVLPNQLQAVESSAFAECRGLTRLVLPRDLTHLGISAFRGCINLTEVEMWGGMTSLWDAFEDCHKLTKVIFAEGVEEIGTVLAGQTNLIEVVLPQSLRTIETGAFSGCTALRTVVLPKGLTRICTRAFENCTALTQLDLPEGLAKIDEGAFLGCTGLVRVILPSTLTGFGMGAPIFDGRTVVLSAATYEQCEAVLHEQALLQIDYFFVEDVPEVGNLPAHNFWYYDAFGGIVAVNASAQT